MGCRGRVLFAMAFCLSAGEDGAPAPPAAGRAGEAGLEPVRKLVTVPSTGRRSVRLQPRFAPVGRATEAAPRPVRAEGAFLSRLVPPAARMAATDGRADRGMSACWDPDGANAAPTRSMSSTWTKTNAESSETRSLSSRWTKTDRGTLSERPGHAAVSSVGANGGDLSAYWEHMRTAQGNLDPAMEDAVGTDSLDKFNQLSAGIRSIMRTERRDGEAPSHIVSRDAELACK